MLRLDHARAHAFTFCRRLSTDRRGVSALEFAMIAPLMVLLYFGMAELSSGIMAARRSSHATSTIGDLVAQQNGTVASSTLLNIFMAASDVMAPFPVATLQTRVTSVTMDSSKTSRVDWSCTPKGQSGLTSAVKSTAVTLPSNLESASGDSVIESDAWYVFASPAKYVLPNGLTFKDTFYFKPRKSTAVTYTADSSSGSLSCNS